MVGRLRALVSDSSGTTAIEYGLIATLIALAIIGSLNALFTDSVSGLFTVIMNQVMAALAG